MFRFCVGYCALNEASITDGYPLPNVDAVLDAQAGFPYYSILDGFSGYYAIPLHPESIALTAFQTPFGVYGWTVAAFGLKNSPPCYMRLMDETMAGVPRTTPFVDDVNRGHLSVAAIPSDLHEVLTRLEASSLKLKPRKCRIGYAEVEFVGHKISAKGISTHEDKIVKVVAMTPPRTCDEVRSFLGLAGYYRRFVRGFADIARPLNKLLGQSARFGWSKEQQQGFEALKTALTTAPVLAQPNWVGAANGTAPLVLDTDASTYALGGVLSQDTPTGERPIYYYSRRFTPAECNYSTTEREGLAVVASVKRLRPYLLGHHFTVRTDHSALTSLLKNVNATGRIARWICYLMEYDFTIVTRPGRVHANADGLSRLPVEPRT